VEQASSTKSVPTPPFPGANGRRRWRKRRIVLFSAISFLNVALLALLWSQLLTPAQSQLSGGSTGPVNSPLVGKPAPDFTLPALGESATPDLRLAAFRGKLLMINFWASWCDPCKQEAPVLATKWEQVKSQGFQFLGIDFQDNRANGLAFIQKYAVLYPNAIDDTGATAISYGVTGVPETVFIDRRGIIIRKVVGQLTMQTLQENLDLLMQDRITQAFFPSVSFQFAALITTPVSERRIVDLER